MYTAYRVLFLALLLAAALFPVHLTHAQDNTGGAEFPPLTGEYAVGKLEYHWIDETRDESFTEAEDDKRELMVTVYYPAVPDATSQPAPYMQSPVLELTAQYAGVPQQFLEAMKPHGYASAPAAEGRFPVLIFSPGFGNLTVYYTALLEEVASHGYIIVALTHPYSSNVVVFPDGRAVMINEAGADLENQREAIFEVWVQDALFALNKLEALDSDDDLLAGHLDLDRIGMFGHSFGGAVSAEISYRDARVLASIDMDGTLLGEVVENGAVRPFMLMSSEVVEPSDAEMRGRESAVNRSRR